MKPIRILKCGILTAIRIVTTTIPTRKMHPVVVKLFSLSNTVTRVTFLKMIF